MKTYKWRIYADANIEKEMVESLRRANLDVLWIAEDKSLRRQKDDSFHYNKARQLNRYLLTKDKDFWSDSKYLLHESLGVIIVTTQNKDVGSLIVRLLRKLIQDYNPLSDPLYLDGIKVKLSESGISLKILDHDTQKKTVDSWAWDELF